MKKSYPILFTYILSYLEKAYQNGAGSYQTLANQFDIDSLSTVRKWVKTV
ncbi:hypothetical protein [Enterococcus sp. DIV1420a]